MADTPPRSEAGSPSHGALIGLPGALPTSGHGTMDEDAFTEQFPTPQSDAPIRPSERSPP
eukprot:15458007-Alexandrium_andersonii.AAC.1